MCKRKGRKKILTQDTYYTICKRKGGNKKLTQGTCA